MVIIALSVIVHIAFIYTVIMEIIFAINIITEIDIREDLNSSPIKKMTLHWRGNYASLSNSCVDRSRKIHVFTLDRHSTR